MPYAKSKYGRVYYISWQKYNYLRYRKKAFVPVFKSKNAAYKRSKSYYGKKRGYSKKGGKKW